MRICPGYPQRTRPCPRWQPAVVADVAAKFGGADGVRIRRRPRAPAAPAPLENSTLSTQQEPHRLPVSGKSGFFVAPFPAPSAGGLQNRLCIRGGQARIPAAGDADGTHSRGNCCRQWTGSCEHIRYAEMYFWVLATTTFSRCLYNQ